MDNYLDQLLSATEGPSAATYPAVNVIQEENKTVHIELAVPGFAKDDITIGVENHSLVIKGITCQEVDDRNYVHNGIECRSFERRFTLEEEYETGEFIAQLDNGILTVTVVPKEPTKRSINIL